jgi:hypothetical protein
LPKSAIFLVAKLVFIKYNRYMETLDNKNSRRCFIAFNISKKDKDYIKNGIDQMANIK